MKFVLDMSLTWVQTAVYSQECLKFMSNNVGILGENFQKGYVMGTVWGLISNWRYRCEQFHNHLVHDTPETAVYTRLLCRVSTPFCVKRHFVNMRMTLDACNFSSSSTAAHVDIHRTPERAPHEGKFEPDKNTHKNACCPNSSAQKYCCSVITSMINKLVKNKFWQNHTKPLCVIMWN